jgi:hypothetical protein
VSCESHEDVVECGSAQTDVDDLDGAGLECTQDFPKGIDADVDRS